MPFELERTWSHTPDFHVVDGVFTPDECARIRGLHDGLKVMEAVVETAGSSYRNTDVFWLRPGLEAHAWVYDRVARHSLALNAETYQFELDTCTDLQLARYAPGQHYDWHTDLGADGYSRRKLSIAVILSAPQDFEGGQLQFGGDKFTRNAPMSQGSALVFPSWLRHRVTPVTDGERWTLVGWWLGPPFR